MTKAINIPSNMDILYLTTLHEKSITVAYGNEKFGPYPSRSGLSLAATDMQQKHPDVWSTAEDCGNVLMMMHFYFMSKKKNAAGMDYPVKDTKGPDA